MRLRQSVEHLVCTLRMAKVDGVLARGIEWCSVGWQELAVVELWWRGSAVAARFRGSGRRRPRAARSGGAECVRAALGGAERRRGCAGMVHVGGARQWQRGAAWSSVERRRRWRMAARSRETEEEERPVARGQEIYDKWALQNSLTPVDPTSRV